MRFYASIFLFAISTGAFAQSLAQQQTALKLIGSTADTICGGIPPLEQSSKNVELSGNAKAALAGVVKKVADLGLNGAVKYQSGSSKGFLQKDLAEALRTGSNCRLAVFNSLVPKLVTSVSSLAPPVAKINHPINFKTPNGSFKKEGGQWVEYPPFAPGQNFRFEESGSDKNYIYLVDHSRTKPGESNNPMMVRLPITGGSAQWSFQNPVAWIDFTVVTPE